MSSKHAVINALPVPCFRCDFSTPIGPKNPNAVASWQAKPIIVASLTAIKQVWGLLEMAVSVSLAQPAPK
jgi:hypothetical protein